MKDIIDTAKVKRESKQKAGKAGGEAKRDRAKNKRAKQGVSDDSNPYQDAASGNTAKQDVADGSNPYQALPNGNGNVNDNLNGNGNENGNSPPPSFSKSDELNPHKKDITSRVEQHRKLWETCGLPPAQIILNMQILNDMGDALSTFSDAKITEAIKNYAEVISRPGFDESVLPGGHKPIFRNFLKSWVEKFINEAKPFERFMSKAERAKKADEDHFAKIFSEIEGNQEHG
jgi:hypothetical protein